MSWYLTKIVFQIYYEEGNHPSQFEEQLRLVFAGSKLGAFNKANLLGVKENNSCVFNNGKKICWKFINVVEVYQLSEYIDGAEIYSRVEEVSEPAAYLNSAHQKASNILKTKTAEMLNLV